MSTIGPHWYCAECDTFNGPISESRCDVCADDSVQTTVQYLAPVIENGATHRTQWRFMWRHAVGDENGAAWRDTPPSTEEIAEWHEDMAPLTVWVEKREIVEGTPVRDTSFDT